jgi:uncharacterized protein (TIGR02611 family)
VKEAIRRRLAPLPRGLRRAVVLLIGSTLLLVGVALLVLPGPGMLVILLGLAVLAIEFAWAEALLIRARHHASRVAKKFTRSRREVQ